MKTKISLFKLLIIVLIGSLITLNILLLINSFSDKNHNSQFKEIDVERINIKEPDGTIKMVISNQKLFPQDISMDGWKKEHKRDTPGILFYNAEGVETGGLIYQSSKDENGNITSGHHLSFDRYKQDQTIALTYQESNGNYTSGLSFVDRPKESLAQIEKALDMATAKEKDSLLKVNPRGVSRIWLGTANNKPNTRGSHLVMNSELGTNIMIISVDEEEGVINFLDKNQKIKLKIGIDSTGQPLIKVYDDEGTIIKSILN